MLLLYIFLLSFSSTFALFNIGTVQSVAVRGRLTCDGEPAGNVKLKLYEEENVLDELMDERFSDPNGNFELSGKSTEMTSIDPKLNIYHKCNHDGMCFKKISIKIPSSSVTEGEIPKEVFDIGEINLAGAFSGQTTDCLNR